MYRLNALQVALDKREANKNFCKYQKTFLANIGFIFSHSHFFKFYMKEPMKGTDCLQKSFDGVFILPDRVSFMS